jgi:hypothetical protein
MLLHQLADPAQIGIGAERAALAVRYLTRYRAEIPCPQLFDAGRDPFEGIFDKPLIGILRVIDLILFVGLP